MLSVPNVAWAGELREADVIRLAQTRDPNIAVARAQAATLSGSKTTAAAYPNPTLQWNREHFVNDPAESEDALFVTVPIDLSTRRATNAGIARSQATTAEARAFRTKSDVTVRALSIFYAALAEDRRAAIQLNAVERLNEARRVVSLRQSEGTVSGYDLARIEIEAELQTSALMQTRGRARVRRTELSVLLNTTTGSVALVGTFDEPATLDTNDPPPRPSIRLMREANEDARDVNDSAAWTWVPTLALSGGVRLGSAGVSRHGYVAGVSLSLPIFSRGQGLRARAEANERVTEARASAAERRVQIEVARATQQLQAARLEHRRFVASTSKRVDVLQRAVESGYREGHRTIVELLDARRVRTTVASRALVLALAAKQAEVALRAARGEFE